MTRWVLLPLATLAPALAAPAARAQQTDTLPLRVAKRQIEAFNRKDLDGVMLLFADDATMTEFPSGKVIGENKAAIRARFDGLIKGMAKDFPVVRVEPRVVDGAFVLDRETWAAKPGQRNHAIWMYEIRGGLIRKAWTVRM
ncbi:MAG: nuclear transport factor 2 family protein [Gemmatimonadota bacterium]